MDQTAATGPTGVWPTPGLVQRRVRVLGHELAYVEGGPGGGGPDDGPGRGGPDGGRTFVFVHGNPTSSFLWRGVLAGMTDAVHCLAVDHVGMGRSDKPDLDYGWADQFAHLEGFLDALGLRGVTWVGHDWGGVVGLELLRRRPDLIGALAVLECHLHDFPSWPQMPDRELFEPIRTTDAGRDSVLVDDLMVETVLPGGMDHELTDAEWAVYREPFPTPASRRPVLRWVEQIPVGGDPADVTAAVRGNTTTLARGDVPRLLIYGEPGSTIGPEELAAVRRDADDGLTVVGVGAGTHFLPEDQPAAIAAALRDWAGLPTS